MDVKVFEAKLQEIDEFRQEYFAKFKPTQEELIEQWVNDKLSETIEFFCSPDVILQTAMIFKCTWIKGRIREHMGCYCPPTLNEQEVLMFNSLKLFAKNLNMECNYEWKVTFNGQYDCILTITRK